MSERKTEAEKNLERAKEAKEWAEKNGDEQTAQTYGNILKWIDDTDGL